MNYLSNRLAAELVSESDIGEHLPYLFLVGVECPEIVEFGVRSGRSTIAFLAGQMRNPRPTTLTSYDANDCSGILKSFHLPLAHRWEFRKQDTSTLETIPECDALFIDTLHTAEQVRLELRHAPSVRRLILLHDTELFGENGENGLPGIRQSIRQFIASNPGWQMAKEYKHNNGLMVLIRK